MNILGHECTSIMIIVFSPVHPRRTSCLGDDNSVDHPAFVLQCFSYQIRKERDGYRKKEQQWKAEKLKMQHDYEEKLESQTMRITELQSVIAELTRNLNKVY